MAQGIGDDEGDFSEGGWPRQARDPRDPRDAREGRWPDEAPSAEIARVVLKVDEAISLKRTAAAAWLTAHHHAAPSLPIKPTRMELAVIIALAETYGAALCKDARHVFVLDFIADHGAVALVQRVMYGARPDSDRRADFDVTAHTAENARLTEVLRDARVAFAFLCATWPEVFLAQTHAVLAGMGVRVRPPDADPMPPSASEGDAEDGKDDADEPGEGEGGGHG
ncbi:hypothetical protein [Caballeronia novacaledonica]|uniref:Uncharacterized protein n=1 Tax=Caballeronia novacaledonica TaxID=1544861 RepID=A0AA37ILJ5_9BURK|nr:hypothetical protein [Caballeronia novacaledonica]GJH30909.1 hypothetical protein CBA19CS42_40355 [Caballeronia novacaledonica]